MEKTRYFACICLVLVLIVSILLPACSSQSGSPAASQQVFELNLSHHMAPAAPAAKVLEEWAKKLESNTQGRVKITIFPSETLVKGAEALTSTAGGVCDLCYVGTFFETTRLSLNNLVSVSALPIPTDIRGTTIWDKLWEKYPQMMDEFQGVKPLFHYVALTSSLHTKKPVRVPDDIKGMKLSALGDNIKILQAAGAAPVGMSPNDWYMSLEKGVVEGILSPVNVITDRGIQELTTNHIDLGLGQAGSLMIVNLKVWDSFPPDIQKAFTDLDSWATDEEIKANAMVEEQAWKQCAGQNIVKPTAEELKLWIATCQPSADAWIKANESKGPSQEMFQYAQQLIAETK